MTALWATFALMTGAAVFLVLATLARHRGAASGAAAADVAVYRDQIDEIVRDRSRGLIGEVEAESARAEVARRLIAAAGRQQNEAAGTVGADRRRRIAAVAALVGVPLIALGGYAALGRPTIPDMPLAARKTGTPDKADVAELISRVETALAKNPEDGRGWAAIAPIYLQLGRPADAAKAYGEVVRLLGATPDREADHGEALIAAAEGKVTPEARAALDRSQKGDEPSVKGAFYLARGDAEAGDVSGAIGRLKPLLAKAPADAPYVAALKSELQRIAEAPDLPLPQQSPDVAAKTPEERMAMVRSMVDGLGDRLARDGGDIGEWLRLARARAALGEEDRAREALKQARERFSGDSRAAARIEALSLGLGLEAAGA